MKIFQSSYLHVFFYYNCSMLTAKIKRENSTLSEIFNRGVNLLI